MDTIENSAIDKAKKYSSMQTRKRQKVFFIVVMLFIPVSYWLFHWIYINGSAILMAFQDQVGDFTLHNFHKVRELLFQQEDSTIKRGLYNTVRTFFFTEAIGVPLSLVISYFISKQIFGYKTFRVIFYLPHIISSIILITAFKQIVGPIGPLVSLCKQLGIALPSQGLLHTPTTATPTIIFYSIWTTACGNIIFYSTMSRIPPELIEVGRLEGLQLFKELIYVILPLIWPTFSTTIILDLTGILNAGGPVLLFGTDVISNGKATTLPYWFFSQVENSKIGTHGLMSAIGLCLTAVSVPFTLFIRWLLNKADKAEY